MERIFLQLLDMSLTAGWIVLAVLVLRALLHKAPRWSICLLWGVVALRLVCPFTWESDISLVPPTISASQTVSAVEEWVFPQSSSVIEPPAVEPPVAGEPTPQPSEKPVKSIAFIVSIVWLVGVGGMLLYLGGSFARLRYRLRTATRFEDDVYESERVASPFILGVLRPRIYLPYGMPAAERAYVLAHERAHLRRGDHIIKLFASLLLAVYWFHPLLWLAYTVLCRDLEMACDERVIREYDVAQRQAYSTALLSNSTPRRLPACPLAFGEVGVKQRIKNVMHYKKPAFWIVMVAVVAALATAVCLLTSPRQKETDAPYQFSAVVLEIKEKTILVDAVMDENSSITGLISVSLPAEGAPVLTPGDTVRVQYNGEILETYPAMLHTVHAIQKIKDAPKTNYPLDFQWSLEPVLQRRTSAKFSGCPIYYYGIDNITVSVDGKAADLVTAIVNGQVDMEDLFIGATDKEYINDGGSVLYRFPHYSVLKLHAITEVDFVDGSHKEHVDEALFIGPSDMNINTVLALRDAQGESTTSSITTTTTTASTSWVAKMTVTELVSDTLVRAKASDGSREAQSASLFHISLEKLVGEKPRLNDVLEVVYDGAVLETYPAELSGIQSVRVVDAQPTRNVHYPLSITRTEPITLTEKAMGKQDYKVYYFGVSRVEVTIGDETMDLVAAVKNGRLTLEQLVEDAKNLPAKQQVMYKDGGSMLYKFGEYCILKMNKLDGDRSLFIGTSDLNPTDAVAYRDAQRDLLQVNYDNSGEHLVSDAALAAVTPYRIYYDGIKSVQVQVDGQYMDLLEALKTKQIELSALLSELTDLARIDGNQVAFGDGMDENGKQTTSQQRIFPYYIVRSYYSEAEKRVEFIARKSAMTTVIK